MCKHLEEMAVQGLSGKACVFCSKHSVSDFIHMKRTKELTLHKRMENRV